MKYLLPLDGKWYRFTDEWLLEQSKLSKEKADQVDAIRELHRQYVQNRLRFFLAHGGQRDAINDTIHELVLLLAGNQDGKTYAGLAWLGLRVFKCDKDWPCFTKHGLTYIPWDGPVQAAMASYQMQLHCRRNLWPKFAEISPVDELKEYSPHWMPKERNAKRRTLNWLTGPQIHFTCGSRLDVFAYQQKPEAFESMTYKYWFFDEQVPLGLWDGAYARGTTIEGFQAIICATPHRVPQRPDTGAGGWLHKLVSGTETQGLNFAVYHIEKSSIPNEIMSAKKKATYFNRYITKPEESGNLKRIRWGRSRWFGEFETSEGLVYDNWDPIVHVIPPIPIKETWTKVRGVDPGRVDPFGVLYGAVTERHDLILYREYYQAGLGMNENVEGILGGEGNTRRLLGHREDTDGSRIAQYEPEYPSEEYASSVMDPRTFASPAHSEGMTLGDRYAELGLVCTPGNAMQNYNAIPIIKEWFEPIKGREHIMVWLGLAKEWKHPQTGMSIKDCPRIYVFDTLPHFKAEIEGYINKENSEEPMGKNDHLMTALKYLLLENPTYLGPTPRRKKEDEVWRKHASRSRFDYE